MSPAQPASTYRRVTKVIAIAAFVVLAVVIAGGWVWCYQDVKDVRFATKVLSKVEGERSTDATALSQARKNADAAEDDASNAESAKTSAFDALTAAQAQAAKDFDAAVEQLASEGKIARNPFTGIGIPPQSLMDQMGSATQTAGDNYDAASEAAKQAEDDASSYDDALSSAQDDYNASKTAVALADTVLKRDKTSLAHHALTAGGVSFGFLLIAVAFLLVSLRARTLTPAAISGDNVPFDFDEFRRMLATPAGRAELSLDMTGDQAAQLLIDDEALRVAYNAHIMSRVR